MRSVRDGGALRRGPGGIPGLAATVRSEITALRNIVVSYGRRFKAIQLFSHQQPAWVLLNVKWSQDTLVMLPLTPRAC